ncbi:MAG: hypothetical protein ACYS8W_17595, partial [Planctomycetota bacterium]
MTTPAELNFGKIAISHKFMTPSQVNECLEVQRKMREFGIDEKKLGDIAVEKKHISSHQRTLILNIQRKELEKLKKKREAELAALEQEAKDLGVEPDGGAKDRASAVSAQPAKKSSRKSARSGKRPVSGRRSASARRASGHVKRPSGATAKRDSHVRHVSEIDPEVAAHLEEERRIRREEEREKSFQAGQMKMIVGAICGVVALIVVAIVLLSIDWSDNGQASTNTDEDQQATEAAAEEKQRELERQAQKLYTDAAQHYNRRNYQGARALLGQLLLARYSETDSYKNGLELSKKVEDKIRENTADNNTQQNNQNNNHQSQNPQVVQQANQLYSRIAIEALGLRREKRFWDAIVAWRQYPDSYQHTAPAQWNKVQDEIKKLSREIAKLLEADIKQLNVYLEKQMLQKAEEVLKRIENYASPQQAKQVKQLYTDALKDMEAGIEASSGPSESQLLEKLRTARLFFTNGHLDKARPIYQELAKNNKFATNHVEVVRNLDIIERVSRLYDAVGEAILLMRKKPSAAIETYTQGRFRGKVVTVDGFKVLMKDINTGNDIEFYISEIAIKEMTRLAHRRLSPDDPNTDIALGLICLIRDDKTAARERFLQALKRKAGKGLNLDPFIRMTDPKSEGLKTPPRPVKTIDFSDTPEGKTLDKARATFKAGKYREAYRMLMDVRRQYGTTAAVLMAGEEIDEMLETCAKKLKKTSSIFAGEYIELGDGLIQVTYDWAEETQNTDWEEYNLDTVFDPIPQPWKIEDGEMIGRGSKVLIWKGILEGDITIEFDAV